MSISSLRLLPDSARSISSLLFPANFTAQLQIARQFGLGDEQGRFSGSEVPLRFAIRLRASFVSSRCLRCLARRSRMNFLTVSTLEGLIAFKVIKLRVCFSADQPKCWTNRRIRVARSKVDLRAELNPGGAKVLIFEGKTSAESLPKPLGEALGSCTTSTSTSRGSSELSHPSFSKLFVTNWWSVPEGSNRAAAMRLVTSRSRRKKLALFRLLRKWTPVVLPHLLKLFVVRKGKSFCNVEQINQKENDLFLALNALSGF